MTPRRGPSKWALLAAVTLAGILIDQVTKFLAVDRLTTAFARTGAEGLSAKLAAFFRLRFLEGLATPPHVVLSPFWRMRYVENPNAAFGFLSFVSPELRYRLFYVISFAAVVFVAVAFQRLGEKQRLLQVSLSLVLAGTLGNLIDRLARRYVIDFIDWHWWNRPDLAWPTFNVADSMLVVGIGLLLLHPSQPRPGALEQARTASARRGRQKP